MHPNDLLLQMPIIDRAKVVAFISHSGQYRKYTDEDYYEHVDRVGRTAEQLGLGDDVSAAAYLHDTLEDTTLAPNYLEFLFGGYVYTLVVELTNQYTHKHFPTENRKLRKKWELERLGKISWVAKQVKLLDRLDNITDLKYNAEAGYVKLYFGETQDLISVIGDANIAITNKIKEIING